jgi:hypothetical protein
MEIPNIRFRNRKRQPESKGFVIGAMKEGMKKKDSWTKQWII